MTEPPRSRLRLLLPALLIAIFALSVHWWTNRNHEARRADIEQTVWSWCDTSTVTGPFLQRQTTEELQTILGAAGGDRSRLDVRVAVGEDPQGDQHGATHFATIALDGQPRLGIRLVDDGTTTRVIGVRPIK